MIASIFQTKLSYFPHIKGVALSTKCLRAYLISLCLYLFSIFFITIFKIAFYITPVVSFRSITYKPVDFRVPSFKSLQTYSLELKRLNKITFFFLLISLFLDFYMTHGKSVRSMIPKLVGFRTSNFKIPLQA